MSSNRITLPALAVLLLSGCASAPVDETSMRGPGPMPQTYAKASAGSIYAAGGEIRLFEDRKAGRVGDILTIRLVEETRASKDSATSTSKESDATLTNPNVFGRPVTNNGIPVLDGSVSGQRSFDGAGSSSQSNSLTGDITVTVMQRLPNGNLVVEGEKWLTINQGREFIRVRGVIRPADIETDNSVISTRIANAQIAYSAKGALADANRMGLLARFFNSAIFPF
ncbi:MAG: flagellar basal body L-ring protein FlgH [Pseudomonadota bacterium]